MGIRFRCPQCDKKIHVKDFLAGKRGICPKCDAGVDIPLVSQLPPSLKKKSRSRGKDDEANRGPGKFAAAAARAPAGRLLGASELPTIDPLVESPGRHWFVGSPDGRDVGPLAAAEVRGMIAVGDIGADSSVRREDWPERMVAAAVWPNWKGADPFLPSSSAAARQAVPESGLPDDSAASEPEIYYGSNSTYLVTILILVVVVAVLAVAAYRVVFDPPAWLRPRQTGDQSAGGSIAAIMSPFFQRNYP